MQKYLAIASGLIAYVVAYNFMIDVVVSIGGDTVYLEVACFGCLIPLAFGHGAINWVYEPNEFVDNKFEKPQIKESTIIAGGIVAIFWLLVIICDPDTFSSEILSKLQIYFGSDNLTWVAIFSIVSPPLGIAILESEAKEKEENKLAESEKTESENNTNQSQENSRKEN